MSGQTVAAVLTGAAGALRAGSVLVKDARGVWIMGAAAELVELAQQLVVAGPGWGEEHGDALRLGIMDALGHVPGVRGNEARDIGRGVASLVVVSRRLAGL
jgi:hypothetical protein